MKKWLLALPILMLAAPTGAKAITWEQLVEWAETPTHYHHHHHYYGGQTRRWCNEIRYHEEYVPGRHDYHGGWMPGYVNKWQESVRIPCRGHRRRRYYH